MSNIVYLAPNTKEPFTTSEVIAEWTGVTHKKLKASIEKNAAALEVFGKVARYGTTLMTGRGNVVSYKLNEQQATLLITFLKNTPQVIRFKVALVKEFYAMRQELQRVGAAKIERRSCRASMTDAIKALPESPHKAMKYAQFTNLAYKLALGVTARQLRDERGACKTATASDYMTADEINAVADMENRIAVLLGIGMTYQAVKTALAQRRLSA